MYDELIEFLKKKGCALTEEVKAEAEHLSEIATGPADIAGVLKWLEAKRKGYSVKVEEIGINELDKWKTDSKTGNVSHESGKFFTIMGIKVSGAKGREVLSWSQPLIKQNECGILGILRQKRDNVMQYLMYAKSEPGAVVNPQLSPTLQATDSNLKLAHGGKKPLLAEYFEKGGKGKIVVSVVNVEDPSRFYLKTNRCMIIEVPEGEDMKATDDYIWLSLPQIKKLLKIDNIVNALAREVFGSL